MRLVPLPRKGATRNSSALESELGMGDQHFTKPKIYRINPY